MTGIGKILLIEDHPLVRSGCRRVLRSTGAVILEAVNGAAGLRIGRDEQPDIVFLDINLPDISGAVVLDGLLADCVGTRVILLTMYEDVALANRLLKRGAAGYVTKRDSPESMLHAIAQAYEGEAFVSSLLAAGLAGDSRAEDRFADLSPRDKRIVELLGEGKSLSEISYEIGQSYKTIANVTNMIRQRLGIRTTAALTKFAVERRLGHANESLPGPR